MDSSERKGNGHPPKGPAKARVRSMDTEGGDRRTGRKLVQRRLQHGLHRYLNPRKRSVQRGLLVFLCVAAASFDPLFFYIPMIDLNKKCLQIDRNLAIAAVVLRSLADLLHLTIWWLYNRENFCNTRPEDSSKGSASDEDEGFEVLSKSKEIAIEIFSILPLSQAVAIAILLIHKSPHKTHAVLMLKFSVLSQYVIRASRIYPSYRRATVTSRTLRSNHIWFGAVFNLTLYMIAANVIGAFWYLLSVGRYMDCWKKACNAHSGCHMSSLYCGYGNSSADKSYLDDSCPIRQTADTTPFEFGIYVTALQSGIVGTTDFFLKLFFCFSWALRNLSSFGVALDTSPYKWETLFAIGVALAGLVLFAQLIGNMQTYLQSKTQAELKYLEGNVGARGVMYPEKDDWENIEASLLKLRESLLSYGPFALLPSNLQDQVIGCPKKEWPDTRNEFNLERMISSIPEELGKKIKRHICMQTLSKVKLLEDLDPLSKELLCKLAQLKVFPAHTKIMKKETAMEDMILAVTGQLTYHPKAKEAPTADNFFSDGDFFDEHLRHAMGIPQGHPPPPVRTVKTHTVVEALAFNMEKVKSVLGLATWTGRQLN